MIQSTLEYLKLPHVTSEFEETYLKRMNKIAACFFILHLPVFVAIAYLNDTGPLMAFVLTSAVLFGPLLAMKTWSSKRAISTVMGIAAMFMGGLLVHFGQGPVQIEMHFYFFVLIALLAVFANPMVIVAAAVTAALHHALLWMLLPSSIFNYEAPFWVVAIHAAFVVLESIAACFIARSFFDNVIGLEKKVAQRTAEVEARNNDMRMILNSVKQGFFTITNTGIISEERSAAVDEMFGEIESSETLVDVLRRFDDKAADWLELGLDDVFDGFLPIDVTIDQLPSQIVVNKQNLSIQYSPIEKDDELAGLAVVVTNITAEVERQKLEAESREMMTMIERISIDRSGFLEFFQEAEAIIESLRNETRDDMVLLKRRVHTLKGNAAIFGMSRLADACHIIEDHIADSGQSPDSPAWTKLFSCWATARGNLRRLVSDESNELRLSDKRYNNLLLGLLNGESHDAIAMRVAVWPLEPTQQRLKRISEQAKRLASQLGKGDINVSIQDNGLRTESNNWSGFWGALVHVVRNSVDHGLESMEDRNLSGKSTAGHLTLKTICTEDRYVVSIADDGKGIDWDRIREVAEERGIQVKSNEDLVDVLFADGVSTAAEVTDTSGRGVGMGALKEACESLDGSIQVISRRGEGTEFRFSFPIEKMAPETHELLASYGISNCLESLTSGCEA